MSAAQTPAAWAQRAADEGFTAALRGIEWIARRHPATDPARHDVDVIADVPYLPDGDAAHRLDVYVPRRAKGPRPALIYVHGGGFRHLSKETLWLAALTCARRGHVVFNVEYRLGRRYPDAITDVAAAAIWVQRHGARFGADVARLAIAGESAGGNLATALSLACAYRRPEPWARAVWDAGVRPRAAAIAYGLLQVSAPDRFRPRGPLGPWIRGNIRGVAAGYLGDAERQPGAARLADPLLVLESGAAPARPLPWFFAGAGDRDPLLDDTRRLGAALARLGVPHLVRVYAGGVHGFHVLLPWTDRARAMWRDQLDFLDRALEEPAASRAGRARPEPHALAAPAWAIVPSAPAPGARRRSTASALPRREAIAYAARTTRVLHAGLPGPARRGRRRADRRARVRRRHRRRREERARLDRRLRRALRQARRTARTLACLLLR